MFLMRMLEEWFLTVYEGDGANGDLPLSYLRN